MPIERTQFTTADEKLVTWGDGPWVHEPDRVEWRSPRHHYPCLALRNPEFGHWCGYVGVPPGHALHGTPYADVNVMVHGGLTFANRCAETETGEQDLRFVCHVPAPGEPTDVWWFGFDCSHYMDLNPGIERTLAHLGVPTVPRPTGFPFPEKRYRDIGYVMQEVRALAAQLWQQRR